MHMVGRNYFQTFRERRVSLRHLLAFARSARLNYIQQNRFKLLNKDRIYYLGSPVPIRDIPSRESCVSLTYGCE